MRFDWSPGIGDPTAMGWLTVVLYLAAAFQCARVTRRLGEAGNSSGREIDVWRCLSILLLGLGINKQLDLQSALTEAGRILAHIMGWYDQRRIVQLWFVALVAVLCLASLLVLIVWTRQAPGATQLALIGTMLLLSFVVIRAASFHHFDNLIGARFLGLWWNWILEIGGIAVVLLASLRR